MTTDHRQLAQGREKILHRPIVHVEHEALQLLFGDGQKSSANEIAVHRNKLGRGRARGEGVAGANPFKSDSCFPRFVFFSEFLVLVPRLS